MGFIALDQGEQERGFVPLSGAPKEKSRSGFTTLQADPEQPSITKQAALNNPLSAIAETGLNLASQAVALPVAGLAGLATEAGNAMGLTEKKGADVVHQVGEAMTYQPRGEMGKAATEIATYPFQKLAEAGQWAGGKTLEATDSPALATAVDTMIQGVLPMVAGPLAKKGSSVIKERIGKTETPLETIVPETQVTNGGPAVAEVIRPVARSAENAMARDSVSLTEGFTNEHNNPIAATAKAEAGIREATSSHRVQRLGEHESALFQPEVPALESLRRGGDQGLPGMAEQIRDVPEGRRAEAQPETPAIAQGFDQGILAGERGVGGTGYLGHPEKTIASRNVARGRSTGLEGREGYRSESISASDHAGQWIDHSRTAVREARIIDPATGPLSRAAAIARPDLVKPAEASSNPIPVSRSAAEPARGFTPLADTERAAQPGTQYSFAPGANYAPLIDDSRAPVGTAPATAVGRDKPIRREDIIVPFAKDLGASIYTGRVTMKNALGFFRRGNEEVRIKKHADLEVTAHEMAHLIDSRVPALSQEWRSNSALRKELKTVSYDRESVSEGWAESVRLWMTQPDVLQQRAPMVFNWIEGFVASDKKYGPPMRKAQEGMTGWFAQDAVDRARSKIGDHRPLSDAMNGIFDRFRQSTVDDLHGIYRMERELQGGKLEPVGAYESARLSRASASIADGAVRFGYPVKSADGSFTYRGKGLQDILKPVAERLDDALLYFVGRSANELMLQGREHLFTKGEIRGMLALETPEARKAFAEYQAWNRGVLDFAEAQGVLNPETRAKWKRTEYLPFHRVEQPGGLKGKPGDWAGVQALTGGTENIRDVLGNMIGNAAQLIDVAVKNEARVKIANLASRPGGGKFMAKIDPGSRPVKVSGNQVLDEMAKRYGLMVDGEAPAFFQFLLHNQAPAGGNVVAVLKQGKPVWYEVADPILYRAMSAIDRPPQHWLVGWLGLPKRIGQATITLDPSFIAANLSRDQVMAGVMTQSGFLPVVDAMRGLKSRLAEDATYRQWVANGGGLSSLFMDEGALRKHMERFYVDHGIDPKTVVDAPAKALYFVERVGDAIESSTRIGEFSRALEAGDNPRHAAYKAREISVDWSMKGDSKALGVAFDTVMFLRAAMVSMDRVFRGVAHDQNRGAIAAKAGLIGLASAALYLMNRGDPRYDDMEDWKKDAFWHVFAGSEHFMIPKAFEVGAIGTLAERTVERTLDTDPAGLGKDAARVIGNVFGLNWKPQIIAPLYDQATNSQGLTRAKIETPGMDNVEPFLRSKPTTSETLKAAGMATRNLPEALQVNPVRAEALVKGYFNSWATYGLMASDAIFFGDKKPAMRADEMPVVKKFYAQEPPKSTKFDREFYDMLGEAKRLQGTLRELDKMGRPEIADEKERSPFAGEAKPLERAQQNIKVINSEMMKTHRDKSLTPDEKRQRIDELIAEKNALLKATVTDAKAAQKQ